MSNMAGGAWFYTRQGAQCGPVDFAMLQEKARNGELNPRIDLVWTQGMTDWKPAGEIEDLLEKRVTPPEMPETLAPATDSYQPPMQNDAADLLVHEGGWPGARRRTYILVTIILPLFMQVGLALIAPMMSKNAAAAEPTALMLLAATLVMMALIILTGVQRLANVGMSRWWYLGNLVPFLNLWVGYRMLACPAGYAHHKKLDGAGVALAIFYWMMILLAVLMVASLIALMLGAIGSPEIQQQLEEAFRNMSKGAN